MTTKTTSTTQRTYTLDDAIESLRSLDSLIEAKVNKAVKQAVAMQLGKEPVNNGQAWDGSLVSEIRGHINGFITYKARKYGRTEAAVRIRLLRIMKHDYPTDWIIAGK